jgi:hypothetical protein
MDALAQLRSDTAHAANAIASLEAVAAGATGPFAEQARLTAAQVAYEGERYADADRLASAIPESSPVAAPALFTKAWALYKLDRVEDAERGFSAFTAKYPNRPEHDEAELMAAQAQLELGRSADAERIFQRVADSSSVRVTTLQTATNTALADVARALVASRSADLLAISDPAGAKVLAVLDSSVVPVSPSARLDSVAATVAPNVRRVLFAPASATRQPRELAQGSQNLASADAAVAVARYRIGVELEAQQRQIALLTQLRSSFAGDSAALVGLAASYQVLADSLAKLDQVMASAEARLRQMLGAEIVQTRALAAENAQAAERLRATLASAAEADTREAIDAEVSTAAAYSRIAELASTGLDKAIAHHPAFVLRDSLRAHGAAARSTLAALQSAFGGSRSNVESALAQLRSGDGPDVQRARQALADAEARRTAAEGEVIAAVTAELSARAEEMVAGLQKNAEAAQFGIASAAFFRAIDGTRALGGAGSVGGTRTAAPERRR